MLVCVISRDQVACLISLFIKLYWNLQLRPLIFSLFFLTVQDIHDALHYIIIMNTLFIILSYFTIIIKFWLKVGMTAKSHRMINQFLLVRLNMIWAVFVVWKHRYWPCLVTFKLSIFLVRCCKVFNIWLFIRLKRDIVLDFDLMSLSHVVRKVKS